MKYSKQDVFFFRYYFPMTNSITSKWNLWILLSHVYMMIGVKCRQYYVLFSDSHQIMSRSEPESSDFIFLCLLILYFNHFAHYFPIFVDLESIEISFHNHITLLFTINFIQSLTHPEMSLLVYPLY